MQIIREMARLIIQNPTISVKELASRLGYSQEKSVYYWLERAGFKGIKDFREKVLKGEYDPHLHSTPVETMANMGREVPGTPLVLPSLPYRAQRTLGEGSFAHPLETDEYSPFAVKGDILIVDPTRKPHDGQLVLTDRNTLARCYSTTTGVMLAHPCRAHVSSVDSEEAEARIIGPVVYILRPLP